MALQNIIGQGLNLMEGLTVIPFRLVQQITRTDASAAGEVIHRSAHLSEGLATLPFKLARDVFMVTDTEQQGEETENQ